MIGSSLLPLFPLKVVLCPGEQLPLHIFEDRYKDMVYYCLETDEPFGIVFQRKEDDLAKVGCAARIVRIMNQYDDGRMDILTMGEQRFRVNDIRQERLYMTAEVEPIVEPLEEVRINIRERAITQHMKLLELTGETIRPSIYEREQHISFVLAHNSGLSLNQKQQLLEMNSENRRIEFLVTHLEELIPRVAEYKDAQWKIRSDGHFGEGPPTLDL